MSPNKSFSKEFTKLAAFKHLALGSLAVHNCMLCTLKIPLLVNVASYENKYYLFANI